MNLPYLIGQAFERKFLEQHSTNFTTNPIVGDHNWYLHSSATIHVAAITNNLLQHFDYIGKNKLLIRNGQDIDIVGIGHT